MKVEKKVISNLNKCYSITDITVEGKPCFLVAAEKKDPCYLFSESGELLETVWTEPGGIMTMTPVPGTDGQFLSTHEFFSPNDSLNARIVLVTRKEKNVWERKTICYAPFVHRFGILKRGGVNYIIVCCLKTGHEFKNDWRFPGACFGAELPKDLSALDEDHPLELKLIKGGMLQNHGFAKFSHGGHDAALVGCEQGSFIFDPPAVRGADWTVTQVLNVPTSDSVLIDLDGDGKPELGVISPFHGNSLTIWHQMLGKKTWIVGWRKGTKDTIAITWDAEAGDYHVEYIDKNTGCANAMHFVNSEGKDCIVATNREIDEAALYTVTE